MKGCISEIKLNLTLFNDVEKNRKYVAEHDIFILLNNGVAFSLECKTFEFVTLFENIIRNL